MPVLTVYRNGSKAGIAPAKNDHERVKRGSCKGWSEKASRSNLEFLRSVKLEGLTGLGHCFTFTVKHAPASAKDWASMRDSFIKRLRRAGMVRLHWVTEWQRRGVPHLHGVAFWNTPQDDEQYMKQDAILRRAWLSVSDQFESLGHRQHIKPINDALGWLQYLAKHAARGAQHYQRSEISVPKAWKTGTGRMWGHSGVWDCMDEIKLDLTFSGYYMLRRMARSWRLADARSSVAPNKNKRIRSARRMLLCGDRVASDVRGWSEWIPMETQLTMVDAVASIGHTVISR